MNTYANVNPVVVIFWANALGNTVVPQLPYFGVMMTLGTLANVKLKEIEAP